VTRGLSFASCGDAHRCARAAGFTGNASSRVHETSGWIGVDSSQHWNVPHIPSGLPLVRFIHLEPRTEGTVETAIQKRLVIVMGVDMAATKVATNSAQRR
jgi:hypothetical protein